MDNDKFIDESIGGSKQTMEVTIAASRLAILLTTRNHLAYQCYQPKRPDLPESFQIALAHMGSDTTLLGIHWLKMDMKYWFEIDLEPDVQEGNVHSRQHSPWLPLALSTAVGQ